MCVSVYDISYSITHHGNCVGMHADVACGQRPQFVEDVNLRLELGGAGLDGLGSGLRDELADVGRLGDDALRVVVAEVNGVARLEVAAVVRGLPHHDARVLPEPGADIVAAGLLRDLLVVAVAEAPGLVAEARAARVE